MTHTADAIEVLNSIPTNGDTVLDAAKWVILVVLILLIGAIPFMMIMNKKNKDRNENIIETAISGAGSALYTQLVKQIDEQREIANNAYKERNDMMARLAKLEQVSEQYAETKLTVDRLRVKLDLKDQEIRKLLEQGANERAKFFEILTTKDNDIIRRDLRIEQLEKQMTALQIRLARDEARNIVGQAACPFTTQGVGDTGTVATAQENTVASPNTTDTFTLQGRRISDQIDRESQNGNV